MPPENIEIRKISNGSLAVFDKGDKTLFVIPKTLAAKFKKAGGGLEAAESLSADPNVVKLKKAALGAISESMSALVMLA